LHRVVSQQTMKRALRSSWGGWWFHPHFWSSAISQGDPTCAVFCSRCQQLPPSLSCFCVRVPYSAV